MTRCLGILALAAIAVTAILSCAAAQSPQKKDKGPKAFPKSEIGRVLHPFVRGELGLTDEQSRKIQELEASVKQQHEQILTKEQLKTLRELPGKGPKGPKGPPEDEGKEKDKGKGPLEIDRTAVKGGIQWFA